MSEITIRPAREDDLPEANNVGLIAQGYADVVAARPPGHVSPVIRHISETGTLMVAVDDDGTMPGFGSSLHRDGTLVLAQLFILPDRQSAGLGQRLLEAVMPPGPEPRAAVSSNDPRAVALYIRAGMLPRWPHFDLEGDAASLHDLPEAGISIVESSGYDEEIVAWDAEISGRHRPEEHRYLLERLSGTPLWLEQGGKRIGYGYATHQGDSVGIGPLGCHDAEASLACVLAAVRWAAERAAEVTIELSGLHPALEPLINSRMRLAEPQIFMASDPTRFGDPRRYVPTGGAFL